MTDESAVTGGWFDGCSPGSFEGVRSAIEESGRTEPRDWPSLAVETGIVESRDEYVAWLNEVTVHVASEQVRDREAAADRQLMHGLRALDDCTRIVNELSERTIDWAQSHLHVSDSGFEFIESLAERDPTSDREQRLTGLARVTVALEEERDSLTEFVTYEASEIAPNLSAIAGPILAARLIALAGGLESLAKLPSGTVQVLGADDALFAHLAGHASSPKHGVIYTHEYVRGTPQAHRGSAARAVAGKLSIAARVDHYSGDRKPEIEEELRDRIARIRSRGEA